MGHVRLCDVDVRGCTSSSADDFLLPATSAFMCAPESCKSKSSKCKGKKCATTGHFPLCCAY